AGECAVREGGFVLGEDPAAFLSCVAGERAAGDGEGAAGVNGAAGGSSRGGGLVGGEGDAGDGERAVRVDRAAAVGAVVGQAMAEGQAAEVKGAARCDVENTER